MSYGDEVTTFDSRREAVETAKQLSEAGAIVRVERSDGAISMVFRQGALEALSTDYAVRRIA